MKKKVIAAKFERLKGIPHSVMLSYELVLSEPVREHKARNGKLVKEDPDTNSTNLVMRGYYPDGETFIVAGSFRAATVWHEPVILTPKEDSKSDVYHLIDVFVQNCQDKGSLITREVLVRRLLRFQPDLYRGYFPEAAILEAL